MSHVTEPIIAFVMIKFPKITETFILREILQLQKFGIRIELFSLLKPKTSDMIHPESEALIKRTHYSPWLLSWQLLCSHLFYLTHRPIRYTRLFLRLIFGTIAQPIVFAKTLAIFPKCVYFAYIAQKSGVRHIHATFASHNATCAMIMAELTDCNYSVTAAAYDLFVETVFLRKKLLLAHFVRTISNYNVQLIKERYGDLISSKIYLIRRGIDLEKFRSAGSKSTIKDTQYFTILCVAALESKKGHRFLLDALNYLNRKGRKIQCILVGEGPLRNQLTGYIRLLNLQNIIFTGAQTQDEVLTWLLKSDCFVLPSIVGPGGRREGIPNVVIEALACRLPVIATSISGLPELIKNHETGILIPPEDTDALASAISYLQDNPLIAHKLGQFGRKVVECEYNIEENAKKLRDLFIRALQNRI